MPTKHGAYSSDSLGKDKVTKAPPQDTKPKSYADVVDANSYYGSGKIIVKKK